jgi:hypothetical protein
LIGIAVANAKRRSTPLLCSVSISAALLSFFPSIQNVLPDALAHGISRAHYQVPPFWIFPAFAAALVCSLFERMGRRLGAIAVIALATTFFVLSGKSTRRSIAFTQRVATGYPIPKPSLVSRIRTLRAATASSITPAASCPIVIESQM